MTALGSSDTDMFPDDPCAVAELVAVDHNINQQGDSLGGASSLHITTIPIKTDLTYTDQSKPKSKAEPKQSGSGSGTPRRSGVTSILDEDQNPKVPGGHSPPTPSTPRSPLTSSTPLPNQGRSRTPPTTNKRNAITLLSPRTKGTFDDPQIIGSDDEDGSASFVNNIESLHGVVKRSEVIGKRRKLNTSNGDDGDNDDDDPSKRTAFTFKSGGGGVFSDFRRSENEKAAQQGDSATAIAEVIDIDDDDTIQPQVVSKVSKPIVITGEDEEIVCLGELRLEHDGDPRANAWGFPYKNLPKSTAELTKATNQWPQIPVFFRLKPMTVDIEDDTGYGFARLTVDTTRIIKPLLEAAWTTTFRSRLCQRKRDPREQTENGSSANVKLSIIVFAPRKNVEFIGNFIRAKKAKFRNVYSVKRTNGCELCNPHDIKPKDGSAAGLTTGAISGSGALVQGSRHYTRSNEEMSADVMSIFNSITAAENLPEAEAPAGLKSELMSHQKKALYFFTQREMDQSLPNKHGEEGFHLWKSAVKESGMKIWYNVITGHEISSRPSPIFGGILADMMGLGKTLSMLSLVLSTAVESQDFAQRVDKKFSGPKNGISFKKHTKGTLLVCPLSTLVNWENQIKEHIKEGCLNYYIYHGMNREQDLTTLQGYDLVITTYHTVSSDYKRWCSKIKAPLFDLYWFRISLDEAHIIRNADTETALAHFALEAKRRWAITGTPIQNRLDDLGSLIRFLRFRPFDEKTAFAQYVLAPFKNADPEILPKLRLLVDSIMLRRLKNSINLPEKYDEIYRIPFSRDEEELYRVFVDDSRQKLKVMTRGGTVNGRSAWGHVFRAILRLRLICAHGEELLRDEDRKLLKGLTSEHAITIDDDNDDDEIASTAMGLSQKQIFERVELLRLSEQDKCPYCKKFVRDDDSELETDEDQEVKTDTTILGYITPCYHIICAACHPRYMKEAAAVIDDDNQMQCPKCDERVVFVSYPVKKRELREQAEAQARLRSDPKMSRIEGYYRHPSSKVKFMLKKLEQWRQESFLLPKKAPIKSVIFSSWTNHLDLIQIALSENNIKHTRLDGGMSAKQRRKALLDFDTDESIVVILVSIGAGGLGLNLIAGNKAFIMEPSFNPAAEAQAVDRVHRIGQQREVEVFRLIMENSFEENMIELQKKKVELAELAVNRSTRIDKEDERRRKLESLKSLFR